MKHLFVIFLITILFAILFVISRLNSRINSRLSNSMVNCSENDPIFCKKYLDDLNVKDAYRVCDKTIGKYVKTEYGKWDEDIPSVTNDCKIICKDPDNYIPIFDNQKQIVSCLFSPFIGEYKLYKSMDSSAPNSINISIVIFYDKDGYYGSGSITYNNKIKYIEILDYFDPDFSGNKSYTDLNTGISFDKEIRVKSSKTEKNFIMYLYEKDPDNVTILWPNVGYYKNVN